MTNEKVSTESIAGVLEQLRAVSRQVTEGELEAMPESEAWLRGATDALQVVLDAA